MNWQIIIASDLYSDYLKITDLLIWACWKFSEFNFLSLAFWNFEISPLMLYSIYFYMSLLLY